MDSLKNQVFAYAYKMLQDFRYYSSHGTAKETDDAYFRYVHMLDFFRYMYWTKSFQLYLKEKDGY